MAQTSKRKLEKSIEEGVSDLFLKGVSELSGQTESAFFFQDILSSTERTIISKRLTVAFMLLKGYDQRTIAKVLNVSTPTVWRMNEKLKAKGSGVKMFFGRLEKDPQWAQFLGRFEATIDHVTITLGTKKKRK